MNYLTNPARILAYFFEHPDATYREAARVLNLAERHIVHLTMAMVRDGEMELVTHGRRKTKVVTAPTTVSLLARVARRSRP